MNSGDGRTRNSEEKRTQGRTLAAEIIGRLRVDCGMKIKVDGGIFDNHKDREININD